MTLFNCSLRCLIIGAILGALVALLIGLLLFDGLPGGDHYPIPMPDGSIAGVIYRDVDGNCRVTNENDSRLSDATVTIAGPGLNPPAVITVDPEGIFLAHGFHTAGTYTVTVTRPAVPFAPWCDLDSPLGVPNTTVNSVTVNYLGGNANNLNVDFAFK